MFVVLRCLLGNNLQSLGLQGITEPISGDAANDVKPSSKAPTSTLPSPNPNEGNRGVVAGASVDRSLDSIQQPTFAALPVKSAGLPQPGNSPNKVIDGRDSHRMYDKTVALIDEENFEETHKQKTSMHNPRLFYLGTALFVSGSLLTFASFGFAAQSLLASLEGVQFVSNVVFAKLIRKQPVTLPVLLGVSMIVLGVATVVLVGDHSSEVYSVRHLTRLYVENHAYQVFLVVAGGSAVVLRYTERAYSKRAAQGRPWPYSSTVIPVTYAAFSAIFGTQSVVQAKCLMMALSLTANGDNQVRVFTSETRLFRVASLEAFYSRMPATINPNLLPRSVSRHIASKDLLLISFLPFPSISNACPLFFFEFSSTTASCMRCLVGGPSPAMCG